MSEFEFSSGDSESRFSFQQYSGNNTGGGLPTRLKDSDQWLVTQDKKPVVPSKGWQKAENLLTYSEAENEAKELGGELAFCFLEDGPFVGFDLDDVKDGSEFTDEALDIVQRLGSYTEISSSGSGLHVIAEGEKVDDRKSRGDLTDRGHLEVYDESRYFVLTGTVYDGLTSVESRPTVAREVQDDYLPEPQKNPTRGQQKRVSEQAFTRGQTNATPHQVRRTIEEYGKCSRTDVDHTRVLRWWDGYNSGKTSASEADMAFIEQLYFWCRGDRQLMDECFRASGRYHMRDQPTPKWDEVHYSTGDTYGEKHIRIACRRGDETFNGRYVQE